MKSAVLILLFSATLCFAASPLQCQFGEIYRECATCEPTCAEPNPICTQECRPAACQCAPGLVRHRGRCIQPLLCQAPITQCGINEVYNECGSMCEPQCNMILGVVVRPQGCIAVCRAGCECAAGHVRINGVCLSETICRRYF
ncbi:unnamed protein product [Auanema sp. JU1783]|nr:unnamed protein product [Auanema sp. JU1783]